MRIAGVILAGGLSRRMGGGDKALALLGGKPLLAHVVGRLAPQVDGLILSANGDPARFAGLGIPLPPACGGEGLGVGGEAPNLAEQGGGRAVIGRGSGGTAPHPDPPRRKRGEGNHADAALPRLPVVADLDQSFSGPLAGILAAMTYAAQTLPGIDAIVSVPADTPFVPDDLVRRLAVKQAETHAEVVMAASAGRVHPTVALWSLDIREPLAQALARDERRVLSFMEARRHASVDWAAEPFDPFQNINTPEDLAKAERLR